MKASDEDETREQQRSREEFWAIGWGLVSPGLGAGREKQVGKRKTRDGGIAFN